MFTKLLERFIEHKPIVLRRSVMNSRGEQIPAGEYLIVRMSAESDQFYVAITGCVCIDGYYYPHRKKSRLDLLYINSVAEFEELFGLPDEKEIG